MVHTDVAKLDERQDSMGAEEQGRVSRFRAKLRKLLLVGGRMRRSGPMAKPSQQESLRSHVSAVDLSIAEPNLEVQASAGSGWPAGSVSGRTGNRAGTAIPAHSSAKAAGGVALRPTTPPTGAPFPLATRASPASPCYHFFSPSSTAACPVAASGQRASSTHLGGAVAGSGLPSSASSSGLPSPAASPYHHSIVGGCASAGPAAVRQQAQLLQAPPPQTLRRAVSFGPNVADARAALGSSGMATGSNGGGSAAASPTAAAGSGTARSSHSVGHTFVAHATARPNIVSVPEDKALAVVRGVGGARKM